MTQQSPEEDLGATYVLNGREWQVDRIGLHPDLPRPALGRIQGAAYRPVQFDGNDLPDLLEQAATWIRETERWLGEGLDVMTIALDVGSHPQDDLFSLKLLCLEEDVDGTSKEYVPAEYGKPA